MRSVFKRVSSTLPPLFQPPTLNKLAFDLSRFDEIFRHWPVDFLEKISKFIGFNNRLILSDRVDNAGITLFCDNLRKDPWMSKEQSPCATAGTSSSNDGSTGNGGNSKKKKNKIGLDLFKMFVEEDGKMSILDFIGRLQKTGIRLSDPRLKQLVEGLKLNLETSGSPSPARLTSDEFLEHLNPPSHALLSKAFRDHLAIKNYPAFCDIVEETYGKCKENKSGQVATYIPQLALVPPCHFGVSVCSVDGQRCAVGDVDIPFTIQSMSKPLTYALCLENLGGNVVHGFVGQEPSGRIFNELVLDNNNKPHNPMVNSGAIVICSLLLDLVQPKTVLSEKYDMVSAYIKRLAGGERIGFNNAVFLSEREAADRNYAIAFLLRENRCFPPNVDLRHVMDFYFQCCSIYGNCESLAVIAATLANGGTCPLTAERILSSESVRDTLSLMHSCGMYDYSGQFAFKVGIPSKSGVSGGIITVIPGVLGMCCWSPALDPLGNSARGLQFCEEFVSSMNFHPYGMWGNDRNQHIFGLKDDGIRRAAYIGDVVTLNRLLDAGQNCTKCDRDGRTALHLAAAEGHIEAAKFLMKHGESACCKRDKWGRRPLDEARHFGHEEIVELLEPKTTNCSENSTPS